MNGAKRCPYKEVAAALSESKIPWPAVNLAFPTCNEEDGKIHIPKVVKLVETAICREKLDKVINELQHKIGIPPNGGSA